MDPHLVPRGGMSIAGIDHLVLRVKDIDASLKFYTEVLGCPVERRQAEIGLVQLRAGASLLDLVAVDGVSARRGGPAPGVDGHNMDHVCLRVAGFAPEIARAHLARHGVKILSEGLRYGSSGDGYSMSILDPDGNGVELRG